MDFNRVYAYCYNHGNVIVYGEDKDGHCMHRTYMLYDSLADIFRICVNGYGKIRGE